MFFTSRGALLLVAAILLAGCPAPRRVSGSVFALGSTTTDGARGLAKPIRGANVTWSCENAQGPAPQSLTTDEQGRFQSKDFYSDMPGDCELVISKEGHTTFRQKFAQLCDEPLRAGGCRMAQVAVELRPVGAPASAVASETSIPLDAPPRGGAPSPIAVVLSVVVAADGRVEIDGNGAATDDDVLRMARGARDRNPELRAVIKADTSAQHGRVIHVLDLLKQAQITKIAFGVSPSGAARTQP